MAKLSGNICRFVGLFMNPTLPAFSNGAGGFNYRLTGPSGPFLQYPPGTLFVYPTTFGAATTFPFTAAPNGSGGYNVLWKTGIDAFVVWTTDSLGNYITGVNLSSTALAGSFPAIYAAASQGTGDFVVAVPDNGCKDPTDVGAINGATYNYYAETVGGTQWETGVATYSSNGIVIRTTVTDNYLSTTNRVNFTSAPFVDLIGPWTELLRPETANMSVTSKTAIRSALGAETSFPSGTVMLFHLTAAPPGWVKRTDYNDRVLRITNGTITAGGVNGFSTVNAQTVVGSTTLATSQMPFHGHTYNRDDGTGGGFYGATDLGGNFIGAAGTAGEGGNGAHNHTILMNIAYVDIIFATKS
jgi:hypothetical protein